MKLFTRHPSFRFKQSSKACTPQLKKSQAMEKSSSSKEWFQSHCWHLHLLQRLLTPCCSPPSVTHRHKTVERFELFHAPQYSDALLQPPQPSKTFHTPFRARTDRHEHCSNPPTVNIANKSFRHLDITIGSPLQDEVIVVFPAATHPFMLPPLVQIIPFMSALPAL